MSKETTPENGRPSVPLDKIVMQKSEFITRYIERLKPLQLTEEIATKSAEAAFEQWDGIDTPEDCADDEMLAWAADA